MTRNAVRAASPTTDGDAIAVRRASRVVGLQITVVIAVVVLAAFVVVIAFVQYQSTVTELPETNSGTRDIDLSAAKLLVGSVLLGLALIALAGFLGWFVTRRAIRPLGEALRLQRTFVADASHELRTPLTVLDTRLQILQRRLPVGDPSGAIVDELRRDVRSLIEIVNELLESADVSPPHAGVPVPVQIDPVITSAVESMRLIGAARSVDIEVEKAEKAEPMWTLMPATSVHRCLVALLDNALRFSPDGSTVTVVLRSFGKTVQLLVSDHGRGIEGVEPGRIFERFARAAPAPGLEHGPRPGFGIGLALVSDIASRHGGSVTVAQSSANGTTIALSIPRVSIPRVSVPRTATPRASVPRSEMPSQRRD